MSKIGIGFLILIALGTGYWLSMPSEKKVPSEEEQKLASLLSNSPAQKSENQTQLQAQEQTQTPVDSTKDKNINNQVDDKKIMSAILHTNKGDIKIEFNPNTPKTVENFITLAKKGFYDETKFHRVIKGFMSQGGDPLSKDDSKKDSWGTGNPGYKFDDELNSNNKNDLGTIAMANSGPNTNGSQFFINAANNNFLDTKHVVFGKVIAGSDVALAINSVKTDSSDKPLEPIIIKSITLK